MKIFTRILVVFLVPCMMMDPVTVMASMGLSSDAIAGSHGGPPLQFHGLFTSQALAIHPGEGFPRPGSDA